MKNLDERLPLQLYRSSYIWVDMDEMSSYSTHPTAIPGNLQTHLQRVDQNINCLPSSSDNSRKPEILPKQIHMTTCPMFTNSPESFHQAIRFVWLPILVEFPFHNGMISCDRSVAWFLCLIHSAQAPRLVNHTTGGVQWKFPSWWALCVQSVLRCVQIVGTKWYYVVPLMCYTNRSER